MKTAHVKTFGEFLNEQKLNEAFKIGMTPIKDEDYKAMLNAGTKVKISMGPKKLQDIYDSFVKANYHSEGGYLYAAIEALKDGNKSDAKDDIKTFVDKCKETLTRQYESDSPTWSREPVNEGIDAENITGLADTYKEIVQGLEDNYYGITDHLPSLIEFLEDASSEDAAFKDELKIFKQVDKLVNKSKLGKFL